MKTRSTTRFSFPLPNDEAELLEAAVRIACRRHNSEPIRTRNDTNRFIRFAVCSVALEVIRKGWDEIPFAVDIRNETEEELFERTGLADI